MNASAVSDVILPAPQSVLRRKREFSAADLEGVREVCEGLCVGAIVLPVRKIPTDVRHLVLRQRDEDRREFRCRGAPILAKSVTCERTRVVAFEFGHHVVDPLPRSALGALCGVRAQRRRERPRAAIAAEKLVGGAGALALVEGRRRVRVYERGWECRRRSGRHWWWGW